MLLSTGQGVLGHNAFAYCGNNPVVRIDSEGNFFDTLFDIVSLCFSVVEVISNPTDPWAWAGLAGDVIDLVPFVTGVGEVTRVVKTTVKVADKVDDVVDVAKAVDKVNDFVDVANTTRKVHGNSLSTTKEAIGYVLKKTDTGEVMKYGETTRGIRRYPQKFYRENGVEMFELARGSKYDMHYWQHNQILEYTRKNGIRPPWNKSDW